MNTNENILIEGGVTLTLAYEPGTPADTAVPLTLRQFKLKDYRSTFELIDNEFALLARACGVQVRHIEALTPESYEIALAKMKEINAAGFFVYADRQLQAGARNLQNLPPKLLEKFMEKFSPASPNSLPTGPRRAG